MRKKYNILFISHTSNFAGAEKFLYLLLKYINKKEFNPIVCLPQAGGGILTNFLKQLNLTYYILPYKWWILPYGVNEKEKYLYIWQSIKKRIKKLEEIIKKEKIDLIYTNTSVVIDGAIYAGLNNIPHIWHLHENFIKEHKDLNFLYGIKNHLEIINSLSDKVITPSKDLKHRIKKIIEERRNNKIQVVYNGIETNLTRNFSSNKKIELLKKLKKEGSFLIGNIGNISETKNQLKLIEVLHPYIEKNPKIIIILCGEIGSQEYMNKINNFIKKHNLTNRVYFMGFIKNINQYLHLFDAIAIFSLTEVFPYIMLEALYNKVPIIAEKHIGGIKETIKHKQTGFLFSNFKESDIYSILDEIRFNSKLIEKIKKNGYNLVIKKFLIQDKVKEIEEIIKESIIHYRKKNIDFLINFLLYSLNEFAEDTRLLMYENLALRKEIQNIKNSRWWKLREKIKRYYRPLFHIYKKLR